MLKTLRKSTRDNAPTILSSVSALGVLSTTYLTGRASWTSAEMVMYKEMDLDERMSITERAKLVWTLYIPAGVSGAITIGSIVYAAKLNSNRTAAIAAAYTLSEHAFDEYKEKVKEQLGERKEQKMRDEIAQDRVNNNPPSTTLIVTDGTKVLCCEQYTGRYFHSDMETLRKAMNDINAEAINDLYVSLSEFYHLIGLDHTDISDNMGWTSDALLELQFTSVLTPDGRPCIAFSYTNIKPI